jgi:hypothetical protein
MAAAVAASRGGGRDAGGADGPVAQAASHAHAINKTD